MEGIKEIDNYNIATDELVKAFILKYYAEGDEEESFPELNYDYNYTAEIFGLSIVEICDDFWDICDIQLCFILDIKKEVVHDWKAYEVDNYNMEGRENINLHTFNKNYASNFSKGMKEEEKE